MLIDDDKQPRISDFGLATVIDTQTSTLDKSSFKGKGSIRWQAPELLSSTRFNDITPGLTTRSDVYAFACVCYEVGPLSNQHFDPGVLLQHIPDIRGTSTLLSSQRWGSDPGSCC